MGLGPEEGTRKGWRREKNAFAQNKKRHHGKMRNINPELDGVRVKSLGTRLLRLRKITI